MADSRITKAAKILVDHSTKVKKDEYVQIIADSASEELALECYKLCIQRGAYPVLKMNIPGQAYTYYKNASEEQLKKFPKIAMHEMKNTQAVIYIGAPLNTRELASINSKKIAMRTKALHRLFEYRAERTRWVIFYYPTEALAQEANMSLSEFKSFVFKSTNINWERESQKMDKLQRIIDKGQHVRIVGADTDLSFSIKGMKAIKCDGHHNMPDGEVFTTPVKDSVQGEIAFSFPSIKEGKEVDGIKLTFKNGKVIKAVADKNQDVLNHVLNTDKGAKFLGEFGIGTNYNIKSHVKNILFDEKIGGTIHLALGAAYKETGNGNNKAQLNRSAVHWDLIKDLRRGGKIYIDNKLIQDHGDFKI